MKKESHNLFHFIVAAVCERKSKTVSLTSATTVVPLLTIAYHVRIRSEETIQRSLSTLSAAVRYRALTFLLSVRYILHIELIVLKNVLRQSFFFCRKFFLEPVNIVSKKLRQCSFDRIFSRSV